MTRIDVALYRILFEDLKRAMRARRNAEIAIEPFIDSLAECDIGRHDLDALKTVIMTTIRQKWYWKIENCVQNYGHSAT